MTRKLRLCTLNDILSPMLQFFGGRLAQRVGIFMVTGMIEEAEHGFIDNCHVSK